MQPVRQKKIRAILRQNPDGLTPLKIAELTSIHPSNVRTALRAMPDVYVDRWQLGKRGQFEKVCVVMIPPPDCPHPKDKQYKGGKGRPPKTFWQKIPGAQS